MERWRILSDPILYCVPSSNFNLQRLIQPLVPKGSTIFGNLSVIPNGVRLNITLSNINNPNLGQPIQNSDPDQISDGDIVRDTIFHEETKTSLVDQKEGTIGFVDYNPVLELSIPSGNDDTMHFESFTDASLIDFFSRPIPIHVGEWDINTNLAFTIKPWGLYFNNPAVLRKLDNYHMMRANLHVRIVLNGTPFHYSRLFIGYQPLPYFSDYWSLGLGGTTSTLMRLSMLPHVTVDPSQQTPVEMVLPFIKPDNYITTKQMYNPFIGNFLTDDLGDLHFQSSDILQAVSVTAATSLSYTVFAWASDVELVIPTNSLVAASGHYVAASKSKKRKGVSKPKNNFSNAGSILKDTISSNFKTMQQVTIPPDEAKDGMISSVSSVVANIAGRLEGVPLIGDYASMAKGAANGVTKLARFFGFSRPIVLTDSQPIQNRPFSTLANVVGAETITKLTFDPKQALSIEPALMGLDGLDELSIKMMTSRETLFSTIVWDPVLVRDDELFWAQVTPAITKSSVKTLWTENIFSSIAFASYPFKYWSGSLRYRFQFVASPYHTGRVRITYEPDGIAYSSTNYNTTYSQIVDLSSETDVSFVVPWAQTRSYKEVDHNIFNRYALPPAGIYSYQELYSNGTIYVTVLNPLVSPDALKPITMNVFIAAGDDFEVSVPHDAYTVLETMPYTATSGISNISSSQMAMLFGESLTPVEVNQKQSVFFGEAISSFRPLLKRYEYTGARTCNGATGATSKVATMYYTRLQPAHGTTENGTFANRLSGYALTDGAVTDQTFNSGPTNLMTYLSRAFKGHRGAVRWKHIPNCTMPIARNSAYRDVTPPSTLANAWFINVGVTNVNTNTLKNYSLDALSIPAWNGAYVQPNVNGQPGIEVEYPYYSNYRFSPTSTAYWGTYYPDGFYDNMSNEVEAVSTLTPALSSAAAPITTDNYIAAGEDFTFFFYTGPGIFYTDQEPFVPI